MRVLNKNELRTFEQLVKLNQNSLRHTVSSYLKTKYNNVIETNKYVIAEGDIPVALVAHLDTVFKFPPEDVFYDTRQNVLWSPDGLGADDRAGVFIILQIIKSGLRPHIIFTTDEEIGGVGATALSLKECPFKDLRYIIELDRRGTNDCVFYDCENLEFNEYIERFGFITTWGTFSDISMICPAWKVAGVNLSVGYRDEHSISEVLFVNPMLATLDKVKKMLSETDIPKFEYIPTPFSYGDFNTKCWSITDVPCSQCHNVYMEEELFPVKGEDGHYHYYCPECIATNVSWCKQCYQAFESKNATAIMDVCPDCKRKDNPNAV